MSDLIFDKYEIQHRLAIGGMGEVFYAVQSTKGVKGFERPVILKSLLPDLAQQDGFIDQFLDEARVAATLNHPNVVSIYEVGLWNGIYFIAMEYIRGRDISKIMKRSVKLGIPVPPGVTARVIHDAAAGLDHAHTALDARGEPLNIVHRDVSPQNIMVRDDGVTKVVDFGIARASNRSTRTATGAVKGKLAYMAPEQVLGKPLTGASDQFALGIVMWEMCTGKRLFTADRDVDLIRKVLEQPIPKPSTIRQGMPEELDDVVLKMCERDPEKRFPTCAAAARELENVISKFSPASQENPVAHYMKALGTDDLQIAPPRATPSNQNFVVSLDGGAGKGGSGSHAAGTLGLFGTGTGQTATGAGEVSEDVNLKSMVMTTPGSKPALVVAQEKKKRGVTILAGLAVLAIVGGGGAAVFLSKGDGDKPGVGTGTEPGTGPVAVANPTPVGPPAVVDAGPPPEPPKKTKFVIKTKPPGATVNFDADLLPEKTPVTLEREANHAYLYKITLKDYEDESDVVKGPPGEEKVIELTLKKKVKVATGGGSAKRPEEDKTGGFIDLGGQGSGPAAKGYITVDTVPWTKVSVDGDPLGSTPLFKKKLDVGSHTLELVNEGEGINKTMKITINKDETLPVKLKLK